MSNNEAIALGVYAKLKKLCDKNRSIKFGSWVAESEDLASDVFAQIWKSKDGNLSGIHDAYLVKSVKNRITDIRRKRDPLVFNSISISSEAMEELASDRYTDDDAVAGLTEEAIRYIEEQIQSLVYARKFKKLENSDRELLQKFLIELENYDPIPVTREVLAKFLGVSIRTLDDWKRLGRIVPIDHATKTLYSIPGAVRMIVRNYGLVMT